MTLFEELVQSGLPNNEARVYLKLLELGKSNGNMISKTCSLDRSFTYMLLNNLISKGLISFIVEKNKRVYYPNDTSNLLNNIKSKEEIINLLIPKLNLIVPKGQQLSQVTIHEGKEGIKVLFNELNKQDDELLFFGGSGKSYNILKWDQETNTKTRTIIFEENRTQQIHNFKSRK